VIELALENAKLEQSKKDQKILQMFQEKDSIIKE